MQPPLRQEQKITSGGGGSAHASLNPTQRYPRDMRHNSKEPHQLRLPCFRNGQPYAAADYNISSRHTHPPSSLLLAKLLRFDKQSPQNKRTAPVGRPCCPNHASIISEFVIASPSNYSLVARNMKKEVSFFIFFNQAVLPATWVSFPIQITTLPVRTLAVSRDLRCSMIYVCTR